MNQYLITLYSMDELMRYRFEGAARRFERQADGLEDDADELRRRANKLRV